MQQQLEALLQRIHELESQQPQHPAKAVKLPVGKPFKFNGDRDDQRVRIWLSEIDAQVRVYDR